MKSQHALCVCMFACLVLGASAWADGAAAVVEYASGDDVIVLRAGRRVPAGDILGMELMEGDQVQTGKGVFLEMHVVSGGAVIKLAENTTFVLERLADGKTSLRLVYGRIRAKVEKLAGTDSFVVKSTQAVAGVRGTDFGLDVMAARSAALGLTTTNVYCFQGFVDVTALLRTDAQAAESLEAIPRASLITAGEMVRVEFVSGAIQASKTALDPSIGEFWKTIDTRSTAESTEPTESIQSTSGIDQSAFDQGYASGYADAKNQIDAGGGIADDFISLDEAEAIRKAARLQRGGIIAGALVGTGGAATAIYGLAMVAAGDTDQGLNALTAGAIISASALPFLILSLCMKP
ncbi:MAG TPA: FecR family protein [bacterium]|nr:FecR family protein [bacterium]